MRRILLECTHTLDTDMNTGIQRVVHNVIREAGCLQRELQVECVPVVIEDGEFFRARAPSFWWALDKTHRFLSYIHEQCSHTRERGRLVTRLRKLLYPKSIIRRLVETTSTLLDRKIRFSERDVLLMLDSSWHLPAWPAIQRAQQEGCPVGCVYYDLIPLHHPEFCADGLVPLYRDWLEHAVDTLDFFIAISKTVSRELHAHARKSGRTLAVCSELFESFRLGADFSESAAVDPIRQELRQLFVEDRGQSPYLCVGTIEPRKNHDYLLDAFDLVWRREPGAKLCLVGGVGWKCEQFVARMRQHPQYEKSLFMLNDVSDAELRFCYERARSLIFPSIVEGFGLPIVEGLQFGLPVLASDTPIHREVGADFCRYFDLNDPGSLATMILDNERPGTTSPVKSPADYPFATWTESCRDLLTKCLRLSDTVARGRDGEHIAHRLPAAAKETSPAPSQGRDAA